MVPVMISTAKWNRHVLPMLGAGVLLFPAASFGAGQKFEKRFTVKGRPVVSIQNVANGRIEVKSAKTQEVIVSGSQLSNKIGVETEQADDRIDVTASVLDANAPSAELEENFSLVVPEETELQIKTQTGLIYVEQVMGDMKLESIAGDITLKEVSGYIIVRSTGGSLKCTLCAGKLGKGVVEVRFSSTDSFDLNAKTNLGTVDNRAEAFLKPDTHGIRHAASKYAHGLFGSIGSGLAKVELSSFSGTIRILRRD